MYKGLIVNLMFSSREHGESQNFFSRRDPKDTLKTLEIELNLFYDLLHPKVVVGKFQLRTIGSVNILWVSCCGLVTLP